MGMVSHKLLPLQSAISLNSKLSSNTTRWISGLITHLLQVMHTQWIYQCVLVHDRTMRTLILAQKEELLKEVEYQLSLGPDGLDEQDCFLLECNFDKLATTTGEHQEYWLLAIVASREASQLRSFWDNTERQQEHVWGRDGHLTETSDCTSTNKVYAQHRYAVVEQFLGKIKPRRIAPSPQSPTAMLFCIPCVWRIKTPFWLNSSR
jgi:hypothetical protein